MSDSIDWGNQETRWEMTTNVIEMPLHHHNSARHNWHKSLNNINLVNIIMPKALTYKFSFPVPLLNIVFDCNYNIIGYMTFRFLLPL